MTTDQSRLFCPQCGARQIKTEARFCHQCGAPIIAPPAPAVAAARGEARLPDSPQQPNKGRGAILIVALVALLAIAVCAATVWFTPLRGTLLAWLPSVTLTAIPALPTDRPASRSGAGNAPADQPTATSTVSWTATFTVAPPTVTATVPAAATPLPTTTPPPTVTPLPTATPPPTSTPSPTVTPRPTVQPCTLETAPKFRSLWQQYRAALGCPIGRLVEDGGATERFQRGRMLWRKDNDMIYVLYDEGDWLGTPDTSVDGAPEPGGYQSPAGLFTPVRGFGVTWRERLGGPNARIGWATEQEYWLPMQFQDFQRGLMFEMDNRIYLLGEDGRRWLAP